MKIETQITVNSIINSICLVIVAAIACIALIYAVPHKQPEQTGYDTATEYIRELHVQYNGVKAELVSVTQCYIDSVAPNSGLRALVLVENCEKYGIPITFTLAQGEIESHFGTTGLAFRTNSVWNVGAFDNYNYSDIQHKFSNPNDSVVPYLKLLATNYLPNKTIEDLLENFIDINGNRYASDTLYESKLQSKISYIKEHYPIDDLQSRLNYYKIRL